MRGPFSQSSSVWLGLQRQVVMLVEAWWAGQRAGKRLLLNLGRCQESLEDKEKQPSDSCDPLHSGSSNPKVV